MSIPKEPRMLMITLMYLVLMALLALNISAEIMNAFYDLEKSMVTSNKLTSDAVKATYDGIQPLLDKKPQLRAPLNEGISEVRSFVSEFADKIDYYKQGLTVVSSVANEELLSKEGEIDKIISNSSRDSVILTDGTLIPVRDDKGHIKVSKDKDWTTWWMVKKHKGDELEEFIDSTRNEMIRIYSKTMKACQKEAKLKDKEVAEKIANFESNLTLAIDTTWQSNSDKATWAEYNFYQMPYAACMPKLEKLKSDARAAEALMVNDLAGLVGGRELKLNKFFPIMNAKKGYVIKGEKFEAEVAIGAFSSEFAKTSNVKVNGQRVNLNAEGKGTFSETANTLGKRTINLSATVTNPLSGEVMSGKSSFEYEVGVRSATVSASKMNVFYIGVDNPVEVAVAGVNSNKIKTSCSGGGCNMTKKGGAYNVRVSTPGDATITAGGEGFSQKFKFRVKRIPDPVASFSPMKREDSGTMGNGSFSARQGIVAALLNFDFEAKCTIQGFELTRVPKRQDPQRAQNSGPRYSGKAANLVKAAKPGDIFYFDNIKGKCPGDKAGRKLNTMVWQIK